MNELEMQQGQPVDGEAQRQEQMKQLLVKVIQLLQQGVTPEELLQKGVPKEVIEMAIQYIRQHQGGGDNDGDEGQPQLGM